MRRTALYDRIGRTYDHARRADPGITAMLAELLGTPRNGPVLDVACGTANYTAALAAHGYGMTGLEISSEMLSKARAKAAGIRLVQGDAMRLPFAASAFPRAVCTLAAHHFPDLTGAFREIRRVLGAGPFVLFTSFAEQMERYWIARYFPEIMARAMKQMAPEAHWRQALAAAGFTAVETVSWEVPVNLEDLFWYAGKHRPELYFDAGYRAGVSAFANLAQEGEIEMGLARLRADLDSGAFPAILAASRHEKGDYAFMVARP